MLPCAIQLFFDAFLVNLTKQSNKSDYWHQRKHQYAATSKVITVLLATKPIDENDGKDESPESTAYSEASFEQ